MFQSIFRRKTRKLFILGDIMRIPFLPFSPIANIAIGAVGALVSPYILKPIFNGAIRAGVATKDYAQQAWDTGVQKVRIAEEEASLEKIISLETEIMKLRSELEAKKNS